MIRVRAKETEMREVQWTVPAILTHAGNVMFKPAWWRSVCPAHLPEFFWDLRTGVYYDYIGRCWGRPVYRQRQTMLRTPSNVAPVMPYGGWE